MEKYIYVVIFIACGLFAQAQTLPLNFEANVNTSNFIDFDGGTATVLPNAQSNGINTSATVAKIVRNGGQVWAGSKILLPSNLSFNSLNAIRMKVFTTAPVGTVVKFKLEGNGSTERDVRTTVSGQWETLTWDFTGTPANFNALVFMFDFGNVGNGSSNSTFLFDDIEQVFVGFQIDLPVNFEDPDVNYTTTDFGGNVSTLVTDPTNINNQVVKVVKTNQAATWAGTTIGTPAGFATNIPLTLNASKMNVRVWSPAAGTPIRLKVEDHGDPTHTCETQTNTTLSGAWETMEFDFSNQAPGTESLSVGLSMGWTYNMASIFFNFGTEGAISGEKTYYFDDVKFGAAVVATNEIAASAWQVFPNPATSSWTIASGEYQIQKVELIDIQGKTLVWLQPNQTQVSIPAMNMEKGIYFARITCAEGMSMVKLIKK